MGGFHDDGVETLRILPVGEEEGAIVEIHGMAADDEGEVARLEHGRRTGEPLLAEGLAAETTVGEEAHRRGDFKRSESRRIEGASHCRRDGRADPGGEGGLHRGFVDDRQQGSSAVAGCQQGSQYRVAVARGPRTRRIGRIDEGDGSTAVV